MDEADPVNDVEYQYDEDDYEEIEEVNFPYSEFTEEEDLTYYNNH